MRSFIDKLSIQGIRSFNQHPPQVIQFFRPLTIILGANGSGKTTIIECLKAASTGIKPPGSQNGRLWIQDLKVSGETKVMAKISLRFQGVNEKTILVSRGFQLSQKTKERRELKTLDSSIKIMSKDGKEISNTSRCGDINKYVSEMMGTTRAILEHVVFCHQEESTWPLSDSKNLKEKIDDIFSSTRYSKALKEIKDIQKEYRKQINNYEKDLLITQAKCETYEKLVQEEKECVKRIKDLQSKMNESSKTIEELQRELQLYDEREERIQKLEREKNRFMIQKEECAKQIEVLKSDITDPLTDSTEENLLSLNRQFEPKLKGHERERQRFEREVHIKKKELKELIKKKEKSFGTVQILREKIKEMNKTREMLSSYLQEKQEKYSLIVDPNRTEKEEIEFLLNFLEQNTKTLKKRLKEFKRQNGVRGEELNVKISEVSSNMQQIQKKRTETVEKMKMLKKEIFDAKQKVEKMNKIETKISKIKNEIEETKNVKNNENEEKKLRKLSNEIKEKEAKKVKLKQKIKQFSLMLKSKEKIKNLILEKKRIQNEKKKIFEFIFDQKKKEKISVYHPIAPPSSLDNGTEIFTFFQQDLQAFQKSFLKKQHLAQKEYDDVQEEVQREKQQKHRFEGLLEQNERKRRKFIRQMEQIKRQHEETLSLFQYRERHQNSHHEEESSFSFYLQEFERKEEEKLSEMEKKFTKIHSYLGCYEHYITHAKEHNECEVCAREFDDEQQKEFIFEQQRKIDQTPKHIQRLTQKIEQQKNKISVYRKEQFPILQELNEIEEKTIPELTEEISMMKTNELAPVEQRLRVLERKEQELKSQIDEMNEFKEQFYYEILEKRKQFLELHQKYEEILIQISENDTTNDENDEWRSYEAIERELNEMKDSILSQLEERISGLNEERESIQNSLRTFQEEMYVLEQNLHRYELKLSNLSHLKKEQEKNEKEFQYFEKWKKEHDETKLPALKEQLKELKHTRTSWMKKKTEEEETKEEEIGVLIRDLNELKGKTDQFLEYLREGFEDQLRDEEHSLEKVKIRFSDYENEVKELQKKLDEKKSLISEQKGIRNNLKMHLRLRKREKDLLNIQKNLDKVESELSSVQPSSSFQNISKSRKRFQKLKGDYDICQGKMVSNEKQLKEIQKKKNASTGRGSSKKSSKKKKNKKHIVDVFKEHRSALIKLETTRAAYNDLETYRIALEKSLNQFHRAKIVEINATIKELWQKTYRGQDIDTIEIASDENTSKKRGGYNYRVVMKKGNDQLDMRGRCSAGQKVLACVIIRLALAESFCLNFGVLALDEPTTNLDVENISSLAESLRAIIEQRRKQSNFQLIIITHDEDFCRKLGRNEMVDEYWKVSKNPISQSSQIERMSYRDRN